MPLHLHCPQRCPLPPSHLLAIPLLLYIQFVLSSLAISVVPTLPSTTILPIPGSLLTDAENGPTSLAQIGNQQEIEPHLLANSSENEQQRDRESGWAISEEDLAEKMPKPEQMTQSNWTTTNWPYRGHRHNNKHGDGGVTAKTQAAHSSVQIGVYNDAEFRRQQFQQFLFFAFAFGILCTVYLCSMYACLDRICRSRRELNAGDNSSMTIYRRFSHVPEPFSLDKPYCLKFDEKGACYASPLAEVPPLPAYEKACQMPSPNDLWKKRKQGVVEMLDVAQIHAQQNSSDPTVAVHPSGRGQQ